MNAPLFEARMQHQVLAIHLYRLGQWFQHGIWLTENEAALQWIERNAAQFEPVTDEEPTP